MAKSVILVLSSLTGLLEAVTCPGFPGYCSETFPGASCAVVCSRGRSNVPLCQEDGTWTDIPRCIEHEPGKEEQLPGICPGIPGYCSEGYYYQRCQFNCSVGPNIDSVCTEDGTWSPYPTCINDIRETQDGCNPCPGPNGAARNRQSSLLNFAISQAKAATTQLNDQRAKRPTFAGNLAFGEIQPSQPAQPAQPQQPTFRQPQPQPQQFQPQQPAFNQPQPQQFQPQQQPQFRQPQQQQFQPQQQPQQPSQPQFQPQATFRQQTQFQAQPQPQAQPQQPSFDQQATFRQPQPQPQPQPQRPVAPPAPRSQSRPATRKVFNPQTGEEVEVPIQPSEASQPTSSFEANERKPLSEGRFVVGSDGDLLIQNSIPNAAAATNSRPRPAPQGDFGPFQTLDLGQPRQPAPRAENLPVFEAIPGAGRGQGAGQRRRQQQQQQQQDSFGPFQVVDL